MPAARLQKNWPPHAAGILLATDAASAMETTGPELDVKVVAFVEVGASRFAWLEEHGYFEAPAWDRIPPRPPLREALADAAFVQATATIFGADGSEDKEDTGNHDPAGYLTGTGSAPPPATGTFTSLKTGQPIKFAAEKKGAA